ncbi:DUF2177 family protein [Denitrobaculum tricleocarpae]|uniref:DUF2177 family protein n=1 Tax=Denitrobaculum tricleocarpae TaxID=2591009 RepID=UPI001C5501AC|nr:DUF2177 family protein [Denitrobaculum tricleocarpae]
MIYLKAYFAALATFLVVDGLWLGVVARKFYASQMGSLLRDNVNFLAAGGFYVFYVGGIVFFAVAPALADGSWKTAALRGAVLGLLAYGTYDITNLATIKDWPLTMSLVDMAWGTFLTAMVAVVGLLAARALSA